MKLRRRRATGALAAWLPAPAAAVESDPLPAHLLQLDPKLAPGLQRAIDAGVAGADRSGIAGQYD